MGYLVSGVWVSRFMCLVIMFGILFAYQILNHYIILAVYVLCFIIQIFADFEARSRLIVEKKMEKQESVRAYSKHVSPQRPKKQSGNDIKRQRRRMAMRRRMGMRSMRMAITMTTTMDICIQSSKTMAVTIIASTVK